MKSKIKIVCTVPLYRKKVWCIQLPSITRSGEVAAGEFYIVIVLVSDLSKIVRGFKTAPIVAKGNDDKDISDLAGIRRIGVDVIT